jgi:hypothetical protein
VQFLRDFLNQRKLKYYGFLFVGVLLLIEPYAATFIDFLRGQFALSGQAGHHPYPGEGYFPGLLTSHVISGIFALGGEALYGQYPAAIPNVFGMIIATVLLFLLLGGVIGWRKRNRALIISLIVVICLAFWQGFLNRYDYGLYKILLIGSVIWVPCVFTGIEEFSEVFSRSSKYAIRSR